MKKHLILSVLIIGLALQPAQAAWYTNTLATVKTFTSTISSLSTNRRWQVGLASAAAIGITAAAFKIKKAYAHKQAALADNTTESIQITENTPHSATNGTNNARTHKINLTDSTFCLTTGVVKTENRQNEAIEKADASTQAPETYNHAGIKRFLLIRSGQFNPADIANIMVSHARTSRQAKKEQEKLDQMTNKKDDATSTSHTSSSDKSKTIQEILAEAAAACNALIQANKEHKERLNTLQKRLECVEKKSTISTQIPPDGHQ